MIFSAEPIREYRDYLTKVDGELSTLAWLYHMNHGVFMTPGVEEEWTLSIAHEDEDVQRYLDAFEAFARTSPATEVQPSGTAAQPEPLGHVHAVGTQDRDERGRSTSFATVVLPVPERATMARRVRWSPSSSLSHGSRPRRSSPDRAVGAGGTRTTPPCR